MAKVDQSLRQEIKRKLIHVSSLWMVVCIYLLEQQVAVSLFFTLFCCLFVYDWLRFKGKLHGAFFLFFSSVLRSKESSGFRLTGATWMLVATTLCTLFFDRFIAFSAVLVLIVSDTCAALVGIRWGSVAMLDKSLQGSAAFFVTAWLCLAFSGWLFVLDSSWYLLAIIPALIATVAELVTGKIKIDDNLLIPISLAATMSLIVWFV